MKTKLSVTIEEEKVRQVEEILQRGFFRNRSHVLEFALTKFLENENERA